jgi:predicted PolB exonuclease-like 3'-5' exonuclease
VLFRVLDIETVPDNSCWSSAEPRWKLSPDLSWRDVKSVSLQDARLYPEPTFAPAHAQRVVAVAWCDVVMDPAKQPKTYSLAGFRTNALWRAAGDLRGCREAERTLLVALRRAMVGAPATLVTWNGRTFDLPVLAMRALHLGVPWSWYYDSRDIRYRYTDQGHLDLMDFLSDYGASRSAKLDDACRLIGLPGKDVPGQDHIDGSMVADIVAEGEVVVNMAKVARYCLQDVLQTALFFVRTRYHLEIVGAEGYALSVETFSRSTEVREALPIDWEGLALDADVAELLAVPGGGEGAPR